MNFRFLYLLFFCCTLASVFSMSGESAAHRREATAAAGWQADTARLEHYKQLLITNPYQALQEASAVYAEYQEIEPALQLQAAAELAERCPFFALGECISANCELTRTSTIDPRVVFENFLADKILATLRTSLPEEPFNYVGFASGRLFFDLVVLTKAFNQYPERKELNLFIIDPCLFNTTDNRFIGRLVKEQFTAFFSAMFPQVTVTVMPLPFWGAFLHHPPRSVVPSIIVVSDVQEEQLSEYKEFVAMLRKLSDAVVSPDYLCIGNKRSGLFIMRMQEYAIETLYYKPFPHPQK